MKNELLRELLITAGGTALIFVFFIVFPFIVTLLADGLLLLTNHP